MAIERKKTSDPAQSGSSLARSIAGLTAKSSKISNKDRRFFTEQMALLLETGSSLNDSLQALRTQLDSKPMIAMVESIQDDIRQGRQFSAALARHPKVFSRTYTNLIAASEDGGFLHEVLDQLLEMEERRETLRQVMVSALTYPIFLLIFAVAVIIFILLVVFPKFADLFALIEDELPASTVFLIATSDLISQHWMWLILGAVLLYTGYRWWSRTASGLERIDWAKLNLPPLNRIFTQLYLVQSLRVLSLSLRNGVNIMDALHACREVVDNRIYQTFIRRVEGHVTEGQGVAIGFQDASFIPPVVAQMIKTGEESGNLPRVLDRLASYYENELKNRLQTLSRMAEPVMLLVMGGVVGLIVSSLILPIFKLSRAVG